MVASTVVILVGVLVLAMVVSGRSDCLKGLWECLTYDPNATVIGPVRG